MRGGLSLATVAEHFPAREASRKAPTGFFVSCHFSGMSEEVEYRPVEGFPAYRVGNDGSIWSNFRGGIWYRLRPGKLASGHLRVSLNNGPKTAVRLVHRLVLIAFCGHPPDNNECLHGDGNPANNELSNLRWGTKSENMRDAVRHGKLRHGSSHYTSRLSEEQVRQIRQDLQDGVGRRKTANRYGIAISTLDDIANNRTWKHVAGPPSFPPFTWVAA